MNERLVAWLLRWLKVPPGEPVASSPGLQVFRISRRRYKYRLLRWAMTQTLAIGGLLLALNLPWFLRQSEFMGIAAFWRILEQLQTVALGISRELLAASTDLPFDPLSPAAFRLFQIAGVALVAAQALLTLLPIWLRLNYHATWYYMDETGLRTRHGLINVRERRTRYGNIQSLVLRQNPLQAVLGLADLEIRTAGGGEAKEGDDSRAGSRTLSFRDIEEAPSVRDLIRRRLRAYHADRSGLDEVPPDAARLPSPHPVETAAKGLLSEARAWRRLLSPGGTESPD